MSKFTTFAKFRSTKLPTWAWIAALLSSMFLPYAMLLFLIDQTLRTSAIVQLIAKASDAGLLTQPDVVELVRDALSGANSLGALCVGVFLSAVLHMLLLLTAPLPWRKHSGQ